jgi:hypothetical protein
MIPFEADQNSLETLQGIALNANFLPDFEERPRFRL